MRRPWWLLLPAVVVLAGCGGHKASQLTGNCATIQAQIDRAKANPTGQPQKVVDAYLRLARQLQDEAGC